MWVYGVSGESEMLLDELVLSFTSLLAAKRDIMIS